MTRGAFVSEVPVRCEVVPAGDGTWALERRLDPAFVNVRAAREAFLAEVEAARRQEGRAGGLAVVLEATAAEKPLLVREYRTEGTLRDLLASGRPLSVPIALGVVSGLADALDTLHRLEIVHGDPSPENVLLRAEGGIVLSDARSSRRAFGIGAGSANASDTTAGDRAVILPLARKLLLLGGESPADPLRREALAILDGAWDGERKIAALQKLSGSAPVVLAPVEPGEYSEPSFRVPVTISVSAVPDPRARYAVAKLCAPAAGLTPARAARVLEAGALSFESAFPSPARSLSSVLRAAGARVSILAPWRAPASPPAASPTVED